MRVQPIYNNIKNAPMRFHRFLSVVIWIGLAVLSLFVLLSCLSFDVSLPGIIGFLILLACWGCAVGAAFGLKLMKWSGVQAYFLLQILTIASYFVTLLMYVYYGLDTYKVLMEAVLSLVIYGIPLVLCYIYYGKRRNLFYPSEVLSSKVNQIGELLRADSEKTKANLYKYADADTVDIVVDASLNAALNAVADITRFPADDDLKKEALSLTEKYKTSDPQDWNRISMDLKKAAEGSVVQIGNIEISQAKNEPNKAMARVAIAAGAHSFLRGPQSLQEGDDVEAYLEDLSDAIKSFYDDAVGIIDGMKSFDSASLEPMTFNRTNNSANVNNHAVGASTVHEEPIADVRIDVPVVPLVEDKSDSTERDQIEQESINRELENSIEMYDSLIDEQVTDDNPEDAIVDDGIRFCFKCGHEIGPNAIFCEKCGTRVR